MGTVLRVDSGKFYVCGYYQKVIHFILRQTIELREKYMYQHIIT